MPSVWLCRLEACGTAVSQLDAKSMTTVLGLIIARREASSPLESLVRRPKVVVRDARGWAARTRDLRRVRGFAAKIPHRRGSAASARSDDAYLEHVRVIARAAGVSGRIARAVKRADLRDHVAHRAVRSGGWTPPYGAALAVLMMVSANSHDAGPAWL
jgi:hypothetical protein